MPMTIDSTTAPEAAASPSVIAVVCLTGPTERWTESISALVAARATVLILVDGDPAPASAAFSGMPVTVEAGSLAGACESLAREDWDAIAVITAPVIVPDDPFSSALALICGDIRVITVSFLSNHAGYLSFPARDDPTDVLPAGHDERSLTRALRDLALGQRVVPIPVPAGAVVVIATLALRALGGLTPDPPGPDVMVADVALRRCRYGCMAAPLNTLSTALRGP
jgi:hypothetical protein